MIPPSCILQVFRAIGHRDKPPRIRQLEHIILMGIFAIVFGSDPEDELANIMEEWTHIWEERIAHGRSDDQIFGINYFKNMGGMLT